MKRSIVIIAALILAGGIASAARGQDAPATVDVPWGSETIEVDPTLCAVQGLTVGRHLDEWVDRPTRVTVDVVVLVPTKDGYAIAADLKNIPAKGAWDGLTLGTTLCLTPVEVGE